MDSTFYYLPIGNDVSQISVIEKYTLPFDNVAVTIPAIIECITNNFEGFHENIMVKQNQTGLYDKYGFDFSKDYPKINDFVKQFTCDDIVLGNWCMQYNDNCIKYKECIENYRAMMEGDRPMIVLCKAKMTDAITLQNFFSKKYEKKVFYYLVATKDISNTENIFTIQPEKNGMGNETIIWEIAINNIKLHHASRNKMPIARVIPSSSRPTLTIELKPSAKKNNIRNEFKLAFVEK